jgi:uncharacterized protein YxeA
VFIGVIYAICGCVFFALNHQAGDFPNYVQILTSDVGLTEGGAQYSDLIVNQTITYHEVRLKLKSNFEPLAIKSSKSIIDKHGCF